MGPYRLLENEIGVLIRRENYATIENGSNAQAALRTSIAQGIAFFWAAKFVSGNRYRGGKDIEGDACRTLGF